MQIHYIKGASLLTNEKKEEEACFVQLTPPSSSFTPFSREVLNREKEREGERETEEEGKKKKNGEGRNSQS